MFSVRRASLDDCSETTWCFARWEEAGCGCVLLQCLVVVCEELTRHL